MNRTVNKRTVNQLDVHLEQEDEEEIDNENNNNVDEFRKNFKEDRSKDNRFCTDKKVDDDQKLENRKDEVVGKKHKCLLNFLNKTVIKPDLETKLNETNVEIENDK